MAEVLVSFKNLPLWRGVKERPGLDVSFPFSLAWDADGGWLRQATDPVILDQILAAYADENYQHGTQPPGASTWANRLGDERIDFVRRHLPNLHGARLLEVGAGSPYVAEKMIEAGVSAYSLIDPALQGEPTSPAISFRREYFDESCADDVDVVLAFHCFEHLPDPQAFLRAARKAVEARGGQVILSVPDCEEQLRRADLNMFFHEHMSYFTERSARRLFAEAGLAVVILERVRGNLNVVLQPCAAFRQTGPIAMDSELIGFEQRVRTAVDTTCQRIVKAAGSGRLALHGASNGLNTTLALAGELNNVTVFDGDPFKVGRYLPACPTAIRHAADPSYRDMTQVLVGTLGFFDEIRDFLVRTHGFSPEQIEPLFQAQP